jgi:hypothetical protein
VGVGVGAVGVIRVKSDSSSIPPTELHASGLSQTMGHAGEHDTAVQVVWPLAIKTLSSGAQKTRGTYVILVDMLFCLILYPCSDLC